MSNAKSAVAFFKALDSKNINEVTKFWAGAHQMHFPSGAAGMNKETHTAMT